jgi:hypothetical protein
MGQMGQMAAPAFGRASFLIVRDTINCKNACCMSLVLIFFGHGARTMDCSLGWFGRETGGVSLHCAGGGPAAGFWAG